MPAAPLTALAFLILGSLALSFAGILAGIWANKFDEMSAITNFLIQPWPSCLVPFIRLNAASPFDTIAH